VPVSESDLPVELPYEVDYTPKGKPPLATAEDWVNVKCPKCGGEAKRDSETLDTFFDSAWYYYRYVSPDFKEGPVDKLRVAKLLPIDVYSGGSEHTLGHTLYARFFTKFFKDLGLVSFDEFAHRRVQHGIILGPDGARMSKSRGNVVNPDDLVREYGADTVRIYLCFIMPYEDTVAPWNPKAIAGVHRFLSRIWQMAEKVGEDELASDDLHQMHKTIKNVGEDLRDFKFNTAVAFLMEWINYLSSKKSVSEAEYRNLILMLAPCAPHMADEIWSEFFGESASVHSQDWPSFDEKYLVEDEIVIAVQVNGKLRGQITASRDATEAELEKLAREDENIKKHLADKEVVKLIYVQGKILNFVVK
jgi:leucyl-tRNA synthetase